MGVNFDTENRQSITSGDMKVCIRVGGILYEVGHLFSYSVTTAVESVPLLVFGNKYAVAENRGKRSHQGTLIFNVINQSLVHELKTMLINDKNPVVKNGGFNSEIKTGTFLDTPFEEEMGEMIAVQNTYDVNAMDLPEFDIIVTSQDPKNPNRYSQKKLIGIVIYGQSSAIGLDTVTTQDAYAFMCKSVTPLLSFESENTDLNTAVNELLEESEEGNFISSFLD